MDIPLSIFLIIYLAVLLAVALFSLFNLYHALRFGMNSAASFAMSVVYIAGVLVIVVATWVSLASVDWGGTFTVSLPGVTSSANTAP